MRWMACIGAGLLLAHTTGCSAMNPAYGVGGEDSVGNSDATGTNSPSTDGGSTAGEDDTAKPGDGSSSAPSPSDGTTGGSTGGLSGTSTDSGKPEPPTGRTETSAFDSSGETGADPRSPCCASAPGGVSGCPENPAIEQCVCDGDDFCCNNTWDQTCVEAAIACGLACALPQLCCYVGADDTCLSTDVGECVCAIDPSCCDDWTVSCAQLAATSCAAPCPSGGDCCANGSGPGCDEFAIQACVCGDDPFCCTGAWDSFCVANAIACGAACPPATGGDCCDDLSGMAGCTDMSASPGTQNCVCETLPQCCSVEWTALCVAEAEAECALDCS